LIPMFAPASLSSWMHDAQWRESLPHGHDRRPAGLVKLAPLYARVGWMTFVRSLR
jgi:hypothetical protein